MHCDHGTNQVLAPALRTIIEDPMITKTGQSIMGDFCRLWKYFGPTPHGALELSYLHQLIDKNSISFETYYVRGGL